MASPPLQKVGGTCPPVHSRHYAHVQTYSIRITNTTSHAHYCCTIRKVTDQTNRWDGVFLVSLMYICKTCFRPSNSRSFMFVITRQNASKWAIHDSKAPNSIFLREGSTAQTPLLEGRESPSPHPTPSAHTLPGFSCLRHWPPPLKNPRSATAIGWPVCCRPLPGHESVMPVGLLSCSLFKCLIR